MTTPGATSSHEPMPQLRRANLTIKFFVSAQFPLRCLLMGVYSGTEVREVKRALVVRAVASGHRHLVPTDPALIDLFIDGELLSDNMRFTRAHAGEGIVTITLFP